MVGESIIREELKNKEMSSKQETKKDQGRKVSKLRAQSCLLEEFISFIKSFK